MLVSLAVALLSAAPGHVSLLASDAPALPAAARVLAQSDTLTPPPLPPRSTDDDLPEAEPPDLRLDVLHQQLRDVDLRIQGLNLKWPGYSVALTLTGVVLTSLSLTMLPFLIFTDALLLPVGLLALTGVGVAVGGYASGESALSPARAEHARLLKERSRLQKELRRLREQGDTGAASVPVRPAFHVTLVSFAF